MFSASKGRSTAVDYLLELGADIHAVDNVSYGVMKLVNICEEMRIDYCSTLRFSVVCALGDYVTFLRFL